MCLSLLKFKRHKYHTFLEDTYIREPREGADTIYVFRGTKEDSLQKSSLRSHQKLDASLGFLLGLLFGEGSVLVLLLVVLWWLLVVVKGGWCGLCMVDS